MVIDFNLDWESEDVKNWIRGLNGLNGAANFCRLSMTSLQEEAEVLAL